MHSDVPCFSNVLLEKVKEPLRDGFSKCLRLQEKKSWSTRSGSLQSMGGSGIKRHTLSPKQLVCWGSSGLSRIGSCHEMILPYLTVSPTVSPSALRDLVTTWMPSCLSPCLPFCLPPCLPLCFLVFFEILSRHVCGLVSHSVSHFVCHFVSSLALSPTLSSTLSPTLSPSAL